MGLTFSSKHSRSIRRVAPEGKQRMTGTGDPNNNNRDKHNINGHIHVHFEDVIGEPGFDTPVNSHDCVWVNSHYCYTCFKNCIYRTMALFCALPVSFVFGFLACGTAFCHIWTCTPRHKCISLACCHGLGVVNGLFWDCLVGPTTRACGEIFWAFRGGGNSKGRPKQKGRDVPKVTFNKTVKFKTVPPRKSILVQQATPRR